MRATVTIDIETCKGCVLCVPVCPPRVLVMSESVNGKGYRYPLLLEGCTGCELCAKVCPDYCFAVYRGPHDARRSAGAELPT
jgi:2-oxoglutarate ferredoxin oxidoreductase subunit delta